MLRAFELDFAAQAGRSTPAGSEPADVEMAWRIVVEERQRYEREQHEKAVAEAKRR